MREWRPIHSGNSRGLWRAELIRDDGAGRPVVVRADLGDGPLSGTGFDLDREAAVYRALAGREVRLPGLLAAAPGRMMIDFVAGDTAWGPHALPALLTELSALHAVPPARLELPGWSHRAVDDLHRWAAVAADLPPDPVLAVAAEILPAAFPGEPPRAVLCHGDAGPGNVLFDGGELSGLLDWEFAHVGDPMDDLAWIAVRAALYGVELPGFAAAVRRHYAADGLDVGRFRFWRTVALWRSYVCCLAALAHAEGTGGLLHRMLLPALRAMLVDGLAALAGTPLPSAAREPAPLLPPPDPPVPGTDEIREVAAGLRDLERRVDDEGARLELARLRVLADQLARSWGRVPTGPGAAASTAPSLPVLAAEASRALAVFPRAARLAAGPLADLATPDGLSSDPSDPR